MQFVLKFSSYTLAGSVFLSRYTRATYLFRDSSQTDLRFWICSSLYKRGNLSDEISSMKRANDPLGKMFNGEKKDRPTTCCMSRDPITLDLINLMTFMNSTNYEALNYKCSSFSRQFLLSRSKYSPPPSLLKYLNSTKFFVKIHIYENRKEEQRI